MTENPQHQEPVQSSTNTDAAFGLSLGGGLLILLGSILSMSFIGMGLNFYNTMGYGFMGGGYYFPSFGYFWIILSAIGIISGMVITASALLLRTRPLERKTFAILILIFSIVSFVGMGGFSSALFLG